ncbi:hypothetical protein MS3_00001970 [Schistosoma haematobium]|uniref:SWIM-type domain-containing protein n=2 Tax=Schistosoma haematobium TaxID=6185 RepID=A0A922LY79_SCHHA|nr:hypothetical protein MS3_00001970 [Schistosoma haematobium]KAH9596215.1 hypothetical protein MS3_00001970 [Schistosoma haematobium]CAH8483167.1 unnamed protein product [Schistosoma haematobium]
MSSHSASCSSDISVDLTDVFRSMILNKRFVLWDDFESALKEFQKTAYTRYIHTESRLLKDVRFKYLFVTFNCTFGRERKSEGVKVRQKSSKFRNCQSKFRVRLKEQGYVIKSYNMLHNHPCSSSWMVCDPWTRRLSSEEKENLKPVILHCESADEVIESIKERMTSTRRSIEDQRLIPLPNILTPFARSKLLYELKQMRFVYVEYESGDWLFMVDRGQHYGVDVSSCQCNCSMFMMCRYPCRHMLLAYVKRRNLTAHQLLRYCSRCKLHNTQNFQNNTLTAVPRPSEVYISIQRSQRIHKHRIIEKYGERFATEVEKKVDNYYLRILNTNL